MRRVLFAAVACLCCVAVANSARAGYNIKGLTHDNGNYKDKPKKADPWQSIHLGTRGGGQGVHTKLQVKGVPSYGRNRR